MKSIGFNRFLMKRNDISFSTTYIIILRQKKRKNIQLIDNKKRMVN